MGLFKPCPIGRALTMCSTALSESSGEYIAQEMTSPRGWIWTSEYYAINCLDDTKHEDFDRVKGDPLTLKSPSCPELCNNPFHPPRPCASGKFYFFNKTPSSLRKSFGYVPFFSDDQICLLKWQSIPSFRTLAPIEHIYSLNFSDLIVVVVGTSNWESL